MFINGPYNKIALQTGDSSAGCGVIVKRMVMIEDLYDKVNLLLARQAELEKGCKEPEKKPT